jgi:hypothetical protein
VWRMSRVPSGLSMRLSTTGEGRREARLRGKATRKKTHKAGKKAPRENTQLAKLGGPESLKRGPMLWRWSYFRRKILEAKIRDFYTKC